MFEFFLTTENKSKSQREGVQKQSEKLISYIFEAKNSDYFKRQNKKKYRKLIEGSPKEILKVILSKNFILTDDNKNLFDSTIVKIFEVAPRTHLPSWREQKNSKNQ